jgi:hypothetical protein
LARHEVGSQTIQETMINKIMQISRKARKIVSSARYGVEGGVARVAAVPLGDGQPGTRAGRPPRVARASRCRCCCLCVPLRRCRRSAWPRLLTSRTSAASSGSTPAGIDTGSGSLAAASAAVDVGVAIAHVHGVLGSAAGWTGF